MGPYWLAPTYAHLQVAPSQWQRLTSSHKLKRLPKIDSFASRASSASSTTVTPTPRASGTYSSTTVIFTPDNMRDVLCDFDLTGLPEMIKGSWVNAQNIISSKGVGPAPGIENARVITSTSDNTFHRVTVNKKRCPTKCDCKRFDEPCICAHSIAVTFKEGTLAAILGNYYTNISAMLKPSGKVEKSQTSRQGKENGTAHRNGMLQNTTIN